MLQWASFSVYVAAVSLAIVATALNKRAYREPSSMSELIDYLGIVDLDRSEAQIQYWRHRTRARVTTDLTIALASAGSLLGVASLCF